MMEPVKQDSNVECKTKYLKFWKGSKYVSVLDLGDAALVEVGRFVALSVMEFTESFLFCK